MSKRAALFALVCALVGLGASAAAAYVHYHLLYDPTYRSFCDVNETVSCTQVYLSRFSTVRGIPVAIFGAIWFAVAALLSVGGLTARPSRARKRPRLSLRPVDARARGHPVSRLRVVRPAESRLPVVPDHVCRRDRALPRVRRGHLISHDDFASPRRHVTSASSSAARSPSSSPCCSSPAPRTTLAFFPREGVAAPGEPAATPAPAPTQDQRSEFERWYASQPRVPLVVPTDGAKVLVVKFNDFQCPACGQSYLQYKPIFAKYEARASRARSSSC